jgi:hypothetical protein
MAYASFCRMLFRFSMIAIDPGVVAPMFRGRGANLRMTIVEIF